MKTIPIFTTSIFLISFIFKFTATAQKNPKENLLKKQIDNYVKAEIKAQQIPGLTYAVIKNGSIISTGAFGVSNVELQSATTLNTKFSIGSIGKTFTATAVMLLVKEGKLSIDDPITKYLDSLPPTWNKITIRHLLSHTSGIKDYAHDFPGYTYIERRDRKKDYTEAEFIGMATELPLNFQPGERYAYSNSNFVLLGFIIHKISGQPLPAFMKEKGFIPLGMTETAYMTQRDIMLNRAHGYLLDNNNKLVNGNYISDFFSSTGDMGVATTVGDMIKWSFAIDSGKILTKDAYAKMWSVSKLANGEEVNFIDGSYGLGWELSDYRGHKKIGHGGSFMNGYTANYARFEEYGLAIIVLTNLNPAKPDRISCNIAGFLLSELSGIDRLKQSTNPYLSATENVDLMLKQIITDELDTTLVTLDFLQRMNPIAKSVLGDINHMPTVRYVTSDIVSARRLTRYGASIQRIDHYKVTLFDDHSYLSIYVTGNGKIADWMIYY